jgi:hypothetical protein
MKKLVCGAAVGALLVFALLGQPQAQAPAAVQPGSPPAAQPQAPTATPYVVPMPTPKAPIAEQTTPRTAKKPVHRQYRARSRNSPDNIANQLNAQELAHGGMAGAMAAHPGYGAPGGMAAQPDYGAPGHPGLAAASGYPPPGYQPPPAYYPAYYPPPGPAWYPGPRPLYWRPYWRPWWY